MNRPFERLSIGLLALPRGLRLIAGRPRILKWAVMPFLLGVAVFLIGIFFGFPLLGRILPTLTSWVLSLLLTSHTVLFSILYWIVLLLAWPTSLFALFYLLFILAKLLATPFYPLLAESTLIELGMLKPIPLWSRGWLASSGKLFAISAAKTLLFAVTGALLFLGSFVPGLAPFTAFGFLLIAALDSVDASFEALRMSLAERLLFFRTEWLAFVGLGIAMGLVFFIPGLNLLLFPAAIVGGGDLVRRLRREQFPSGPDSFPVRG